MTIEDEEDRLKIERLYYKYRQLMFKEAQVILKDEHLSEDAVAESFIRIIKNLHKIDENNCPRTRSYLVIICRNVSKDIYKSRIYLNTIDDLAEDIEVEDMVCSDPNDIVVNKETLEQIAKVIENLDIIYRDVFLLRRVHNLSREEIAKIFGISVETVKKRLARAKVKIVESLKKVESR